MPVQQALIEEFQLALQHEVEAAKRSALSSGIPLSNGRRVAQVGSSYQYRFTIDIPGPLFEGAPADLIVPGQQSAEANVISLEGLSILISSSRDYGPFVPRATLKSDITQILERLIERLEALKDGDNPNGDRLIGLHKPSGDPQTVTSNGLNEQQLAAVSSSLGSDTTFIWGPPGTGKTRTIGAIGAELYRQKRSLLVVSHTNVAVDEALLRIAESLGDQAIRGSIIRIGEAALPRLLERPDLLASTYVAERAAELTTKRDELNDERLQFLETLRETEELLSLVEWVHEARQDVIDMSSQIRELKSTKALADKAKEKLDLLGTKESYWKDAVHRATKTEKSQIEAGEVAKQIAYLQAKLAESAAALRSVEEQLAEAQALHERARSTNALLRRWRGLPNPQVQEQLVVELSAKAQTLQERVAATEADIRAKQRWQDALQQEMAEFRTGFGMEPAEVIKAAEEFGAEMKIARSEWVGFKSRFDDGQRRLGNLTSTRIAALRDSGISVGPLVGDILEAKVEAINAVVERESRRTQNHDLNTLRASQESMIRRIKDIDGEVDSIEERLRRIEFEVVAEAQVVATTLTRAYLRDSIYSRRFDTAVLDEASMAPIPALWTVASLADNGVAVGDFRQLSPIKQSDHELPNKWLGRDVFEASGIQDAYDYGRAPAWFVELREQHRMHPDISAVANQLIYDGRLFDAPATESDHELSGWYDASWGYDKPVLLVDTEPLHAWVTSSTGGSSRPSRLNFLSAALCVDIAKRVLRSERDALEPGAKPRILIASPYRPHANLVQRLIDNDQLSDEVRSGTAHQLQGSEASVVIFDLVNDEPHWRVGMFMADNDSQTRRLVNVAITRARRRLIVVGDFSWIKRNSRAGAFLRSFVEFLGGRGYTTCSASKLAHTALFSHLTEVQRKSLGDVGVLSTSEIMAQDDFFAAFLGDIAAARDRVVVYSPFMTPDRVGFLEPSIRDATNRGVSVFVVTKDLQDRGTRERGQCETVERALRDWGVVVIHKLRMHEKLVFIDDAILWSGSLNPLSFSDTQEVMERRVSKPIFDAYTSLLRLNDLLEPFVSSQAICPVCGEELITAEGRDDPFYWRCPEEGCHSRSIDQPAPKDGRIVCGTCGGAVEFGYWGEAPHWRCEENPRHRQRIVKSHLKLPKMLGLVPRGEIRSLSRRFGL